MPGHTPWREIHAERTPNLATTEAQRKLGIKLAMLREQSGLTQTELAERLGSTQPSISQLENSDELKLSTVAKYVHALNGRLEITAVFGDTSHKLVDDVSDQTTLEPA